MTAIKRSNPTGVHTPGARYVHLVSVPQGARRIVFSGQVGVAPDGTLRPDIPGQVAEIIANIDRLLKSEGLGPQHIIKLTTYITDRAALLPWRTARDAFMGDVLPASTLVVVAGLAHPDMKIEVDVEAAVLAIP